MKKTINIRVEFMPICFVYGQKCDVCRHFLFSFSDRINRFEIFSIDFPRLQRRGRSGSSTKKASRQSGTVRRHGPRLPDLSPDRFPQTTFCNNSTDEMYGVIAYTMYERCRNPHHPHSYPQNLGVKRLFYRYFGALSTSHGLLHKIYPQTLVLFGQKHSLFAVQL